MEVLIYFLPVGNGITDTAAFVTEAKSKNNVMSLTGLVNWLNGYTEDPKDIPKYEFVIR